MCDVSESDAHGIANENGHGKWTSIGVEPNSALLRTQQPFDEQRYRQGRLSGER